MAQPLLPGEVEYLDTPPVVDDSRIAELEERVLLLESRLGQVKRDAVVALLQMLSDSMRHVASGKMDIPEVVNTGDSRLQSMDKWEAIKRRLAPKEAELIDVLLTSGPRTNTQLKSLMKMAYSTIAALTLKMSNMGFLMKSGEAYTLREK